MKLLGGMARTNGITFETANYRATATLRKNGFIDVEINSNLYKKEGLIDKLTDIPFVRGIVIVLIAVLRTRWSLISVLPSVLLFIFPASTNPVISKTKFIITLIPVIGFILFMVLLKVCIGKYHGAEHMAANALEKGFDINYANIANQSRVNNNCGSNLFIITIILCILGFIFINSNYYSFLIVLASWSIAYEIVSYSFESTYLKPLFLIGGMCQKYFFTSNPSEKHIEVAIAAIKALQEKENS